MKRFAIHQPLKIGITGGIGSGKSFVCRRLAALGFSVFDCDVEAKRIIRGDSQVKTALRSLVGDNVYDADGRLQKAVLAAFLCRGGESTASVNRIVHPRVALRFKEWVGEHADEGRVFMECALLFESGFDRLVDVSALVYAPLEQRIRRVMQRDKIDRETALHWISLQMDEEEKCRRADLLIDNGSDGRPDLSPLFLQNND